MAECVEPTQKHVGNALDMRCDDAISEKEQKAYNKGYVDGLQMRDFTKEEAEAYSKALDKMYKPTGLNVNDLIEPCDDAISRQAVLDGIEELKKSPWATDKRGNGFEYLIAEALDVVADLCVKQAPPVNPQEPKYCDRNICINNEYNGIACDECEVTKSQEPKTGHWIKTIGENGITSAVRCSECGFEDNRYMLFRYCPNCGCRMVEPQESEV